MAEGAGFESPAGTWFKTAGGLSRSLKQSFLTWFKTAGRERSLKRSLSTQFKMALFDAV
jgi:predicted transcriptional regulator